MPDNKQPTKKKTECPICRGEGTIECPVKINNMVEKRSAAKLLRDNGYSIRQIMRLMGYASPRSVTNLLYTK